MDKRRKYWVKVLFGLLVHLSLLTLFIKVYLIHEMSGFIKRRTTISHRFETSEQFEFPTLTLCMDPPLKPSLALKFGLKDQQDIHWTDVPSKTVFEKWNEISYVVNRDFMVYMNHTLIKEGVNDQFLLERMITWREGTCWTLQPRFNFSTLPLNIPFKFTYVNSLKGDAPLGVWLYLTSVNALANIVTDNWPQYEAGKVYVPFPTTNISDHSAKYNKIISFRAFEHIYKRGVLDPEQCVADNIFANCKNCTLGYRKTLPICGAEGSVCLVANFNKYRYCLFQKHTFTYEPEISYGVIYDESFRQDKIRVKSRLKEVLEEVEIMTLSSLIGSVGGSLGMFFGFSMSSYLTYIFGKFIDSF